MTLHSTFFAVCITALFLSTCAIGVAVPGRRTLSIRRGHHAAQSIAVPHSKQPTPVYGAVAERDILENDEISRRAFDKAPQEAATRSFDEGLELIARYLEGNVEAPALLSKFKTAASGNRDLHAGTVSTSRRTVQASLARRGNGQHHCPGCGKGAISNRCIKDGHVEVCKKHKKDVYHLPGDDCVSCNEVEDAKIRAAKKQQGKK